MNEDNSSAISLMKHPKNHSRCKHIDIKLHFIREAIASGKIQVIHCPTANIHADIFTKALPAEPFEKRHRYALGLTSKTFLGKEISLEMRGSIKSEDVDLDSVDVKKADNNDSGSEDAREDAASYSDTKDGKEGNSLTEKMVNNVQGCLTSGLKVHELSHGKRYK
jgi:hypothetical protein